MALRGPPNEQQRRHRRWNCLLRQAPQTQSICPYMIRDESFFRVVSGDLAFANTAPGRLNDRLQAGRMLGDPLEFLYTDKAIHCLETKAHLSCHERTEIA